ncbi:MAG: hypothetical protein ETSY1_33975 [Candidatus Entotheonella factor]|uniref:Uncharacterized protein n=1 Tax=Entotheonella factor TaxID=1429438 RepID=W4L9D0_ENTF1|nr:hypothetical protein [Candidatus Entotheonella palauensis]ETW94637.1 MAG: hypothetical protein ETSY1_33975 [Candidatus Entotheonella factor]
MTAERRPIQFAGLDPVPIGLAVAEPLSDDAVCAAAGLPPSPFIDALKPYQVLRHSAESYELVLGPEGYGAELLAALQWLGHVAAAGILASLTCEEATTFVTSTLETDKPEWKYEELTEHGSILLTDRYRRAREDPIYQQGLEAMRGDKALAQLGAAMQQKLS